MHANLLKHLFPPTSIDPNGPNLGVELVADGNALDLAQWGADQVLIELDPRTCAQTLSDWERVYGLPESCTCQSGITQSIAERRAALVAKVTMLGGQSRAFFTGLALALGYTITITEGSPYTSEMDTDYGVTDETYAFIWQVNSALYNQRDFTTDDDTEMALMVWGNTLLECVINRYKPAHTLVLFVYS